MDYNLILDLDTIPTWSGYGKVYQGGTPDQQITTLDTRDLMLVEMAAGIDASPWVRQGTLRSVLYFGIEDSPEGCLDDETLICLAQACARWLYKRGDILFGCAAGVSRSSYADCATLMNAMVIPYNQAIGIIRKARPQANPNSGFVAQLQRLETELMNG